MSSPTDRLETVWSEGSRGLLPTNLTNSTGICDKPNRTELVFAVDIDSLAVLRAVVGYLGEKDQNGWWQTSFFTTGSHAFLSPVFSRTRLLSQCTGVSQAAALVHDERIGVGRVYHLFRLPEDMEQDIFHAWHKPDLVIHIDAVTLNPEQALEYLRSISDDAGQDEVGPVFVGSSGDLSNEVTWQRVAALYAAAFPQTTQIYPYFADIAA